jgi:hypothetical protein
MGIVTVGKQVVTGPPWELIGLARDGFGARTFIETGTHEGDTAERAAESFPTVHTIEASPEFHQRAAARLAAHGNVRAQLGDTRTVLAAVLAELGEKKDAGRGAETGGPAVLWLDAHWCCGETFGQAAECPLLDELRLVGEASRETGRDFFVFVDDARMFLMPPKAPHDAAHWPGLAEVVGLLARTGGVRGPAWVFQFGDVLCAVPARAEAAFRKLLLICRVPEEARDSAS